MAKNNVHFSTLMVKELKNLYLLNEGELFKLLDSDELREGLGESAAMMETPSDTRKRRLGGSNNDEESEGDVEGSNGINIDPEVEV